jgi:hypothetical protein
VITVMLALLTGLAGYLGMRLHAANSENSLLRTHVASLKRQLGQRN